MADVKTRGRRYMVFHEAMSAFEEVSTPAEKILEVIPRIMRELQGPEAVATKAAFEYWIEAFNAANSATTRAQLKPVVRKHYCTNNPHASSAFNVSQGLMKATTHLIWRKLYALEAGQLRTDVSEAIRDATTPPYERGQQFMAVLLREIAAETGETEEQMIERVTRK
jgi:hypothetical protein